MKFDSHSVFDRNSTLISNENPRTKHFDQLKRNEIMQGRRKNLWKCNQYAQQQFIKEKALFSVLWNSDVVYDVRCWFSIGNNETELWWWIKQNQRAVFFFFFSFITELGKIVLNLRSWEIVKYQSKSQSENEYLRLVEKKNQYENSSFSRKILKFDHSDRYWMVRVGWFTRCLIQSLLLKSRIWLFNDSTLILCYRQHRWNKHISHLQYT